MKTNKTAKANLENKRWLFFQIGLIISLASVLAAFEWGSSNPKKTLNEFGVTRLDDDLIEITIHREEPEIPKLKPTPAIVLIDDLSKDDEFEVTVEVTDETVNDTDYRIEDIVEKEVEDNVIHTLVQVYPQFPGGEAAMRMYIGSNLVYTRLAREINLQGTVYVSFVVWKDGTIRDIQILRGLGAGLDEEVIRVVSGMPAWIPGSQNGKAVNVRFNMPVQFKLN